MANYRIDKYKLTDKEVETIRSRYRSSPANIEQVARAVKRSLPVVSYIIGCNDSAAEVMIAMSKKSRKQVINEQ